MGKIKDGFAYMETVKLIRKIDDIPELKNELISVSESKSHIEMSKYSLLLAEHILEISQVERSSAIDECFTINQKWKNGEAKFQEARQVAFMINRLAREEEDPVKAKVLRAMGQVAATPHVRWHALVASEYAITIINLLYPKNFDKVKEERNWQIERMKSI
ncbi:MAG: putative immunity protein [Saccharofermentanales bacterium]